VALVNTLLDPGFSSFSFSLYKVNVESINNIPPYFFFRIVPRPLWSKLKPWGGHGPSGKYTRFIFIVNWGPGKTIRDDFFHFFFSRPGKKKSLKGFAIIGYVPIRWRSLRHCLEAARNSHNIVETGHGIGEADLLKNIFYIFPSTSR